MIAALFYLQWHSFRNRMVTRFKRLRKPKYLVGAVVGGLYFYFYFFRYLIMGQGRHHTSTVNVLANPDYLPLIELGGALLLLIIVLLAWIFPGDRAALQFTEAEVAFLFPAPLSRRQLVNYKLIRSQIAILISALFLTLFTRRFGGNAVCHALGWWLILSTLSLHFTASSFARTLLLDRGFSNLWRRVLTLVVIAALAGFIWHWAVTTLPPLTDADKSDAPSVINYLQQVLTTGPALYLLYPFRLVARPFLALDGAAFIAALAPAVLIYLLHYLWVVYADVAFEEASVAASQKMAVKLAAVRSGNWQSMNKRTKAARPWFRLAPTGPAPIALLWKNLLGVGQVFNTRVLIALLMIVIVLGISFAGNLHHNVGALVVVIFLGVGLIYSLLLGPQILRLDFRADLPLADLLKTYPLRGWQIALGEILAPVLVLASFQWLLLLLGAVLIVCLGLKPAGLYLAIALGAAMLLPVLDGLLLILPNAAVVLFPAWVQSGKDSPRGMEVMGQRLIVGIAQLLVMTLALVPPAVAFVFVFYCLKILANPAVAIPPASLAAALATAGEVALGIMLLGKCFERFDVAEDPAT